MQENASLRSNTLSIVVGIAGVAMSAQAAWAYLNDEAEEYHAAQLLQGARFVVGAVVSLCSYRLRPSVLEAQLTQLSYVGGIGILMNDVTIQAPHWRRADLQAKPAGYVLGSRMFVDIDVNVTKCSNVDASAALLGKFGRVLIRAACPTQVGRHTVRAEITGTGACIRRISGAFAWTLSASGLVLDLGSTQLEFFVVLSDPVTCIHHDPEDDLEEEIFPRGVWLDVLRFVFDIPDVNGSTTPHEATSAIVAYCHSGHGMRYVSKSVHRWDKRGDGVQDELHGFDLMQYMHQRNRNANCSDQSGAVLVFSRAIGSLVTELNIPDFGYIAACDLMNRKNCNNPSPDGENNFVEIAYCNVDRGDTLESFNLEGTDYDDLAVDDWKEVLWPFGQHCVNLLGGRVYDACLGPYQGLALAEYLRRATDSRPHVLLQMADKVQSVEAKAAMSRERLRRVMQYNIDEALPFATPSMRQVDSEAVHPHVPINSLGPKV